MSKSLMSIGIAGGIALAYSMGMKLIHVFAVPLAFLLLITGCASTPQAPSTHQNGVSAQAPDWARNPNQKYPDTRYLTAIGTGKDRNAASDDAKKQLAESFVVKVKSQTTIHTQSKLAQETSGSVVGDTRDQADKTLSLTTDTFLRGAEVKEVANVGDDVYALVAVDKLQARSGLLLEATKTQGALNANLDSLEAKFTQEKYGLAKTQLASLEELFGEASALGMSALVDIAPMEARMTRIDASLRARNEKWVFAVKMVEGATFFANDLESCINDRGGAVYVNERAPENANRVEISLVERPQHQQIEGWTKIRFDVTAAIVQHDGRKYRIQTSQTETGRSREAVLESVGDKLSHDLCDRLYARMGEQ